MPAMAGHLERKIMALIQIPTTAGTLDTAQRQEAARQIGAFVYTAEGFGASRLAPGMTWAVFHELPHHAMLLATGERPAPLYHVEVTTLSRALDSRAKAHVGAQITQALLRAEGATHTPENAMRVWVRFTDVMDGDLIVGGQATSLAGLRELVAQAG
jgi:phenylpyruvate tautomerase PptA (4-oxalocrotonate tautomerase family)